MQGVAQELRGSLGPSLFGKAKVPLDFSVRLSLLLSGPAHGHSECKCPQQSRVVGFKQLAVCSGESFRSSDGDDDKKTWMTAAPLCHIVLSS